MKQIWCYSKFSVCKKRWFSFIESVLFRFLCHFSVFQASRALCCAVPCLRAAAETPLWEIISGTALREGNTHTGLMWSAGRSSALLKDAFCGAAGSALSSPLSFVAPVCSSTLVFRLIYNKEVLKRIISGPGVAKQGPVSSKATTAGWLKRMSRYEMWTNDLNFMWPVRKSKHFFSRKHVTWWIRSLSQWWVKPGFWIYKENI